MIAAIVLAAAAAMQLLSGSFIVGGAIPQPLMARDCGGDNQSPSLIWKNAPDAAKSFALIVHDPDAPIFGGFDHLVLYDIPGSTHALGTNALQGHLGLASTGKAEYYGPCPPPGPAHHYVFTLYALDIAKIPASAPLTASQLQARIAGHVVATATMQATAAHP